MKPLSKLMVLAVVAAGGGLFLLQGPDGQPVLTLDDMKPEMPAVSGIALGDALGDAPEQTTIYKWKDANGVWQFSSEPVAGDGVETQVVDTQVNTLAPMVVSQRTPAAAPSGIAGLPPGLTTISPEKINETVQAAKQIEQSAADRKREIDRALGR